MQAQEEHAKKQQHTQNKYRITLTTSSAKATLGGNRTCTKGQPEYALEYVSPLGKNSSATRIRMASSGTLWNTTERGLDTTEQDQTRLNTSDCTDAV